MTQIWFVAFIILEHLTILFHYIFITSKLWLTSHPRSTVVLLDTGTPGTSREIYSEDADDGTRTRNPEPRFQTQNRETRTRAIVRENLQFYFGFLNMEDIFYLPLERTSNIKVSESTVILTMPCIFTQYIICIKVVNLLHYERKISDR